MYREQTVRIQALTVHPQRVCLHMCVHLCVHLVRSLSSRVGPRNWLRERLFSITRPEIIAQREGEEQIQEIKAHFVT